VRLVRGSACLESLTLLLLSEKQFVSTIHKHGVFELYSEGYKLVFMLEAISGRWAVPIPRIGETIHYFGGSDCKPVTVYLRVSTTVAVFTWAISLLLFLSTTMRIAQAFTSNGKYLWTRYEAKIRDTAEWAPSSRSRSEALETTFQVGVSES
jgi:hypothetical protein